VRKSVIAADDAVLLVVIFQSITKHFDFEPSVAAAIAELGLTPTALHVITARRSLNVNLQHRWLLERHYQSTQTGFSSGC